MASDDKKTRRDKNELAADEEAATFHYLGPDRRGSRDFDLQKFMGDDKIGEVRFDAKGNPVWQLKVDIPRRRHDDDTIDMLKCLDLDSLELEDDDTPTGEVPGFNPYGHSSKGK